MVKLFNFLLLFLLFQIHLRVFAQENQINIELKITTLKEIINSIEATGNFHFFYDNQLLNLQEKITLRKKQYSITELLDEICAKKEVQYEIIGQNILIRKEKKFHPENDLQQNNETRPLIHGKITDILNQPLPGVMVTIRDQSKGTITNTEGEYILMDVPDQALLEFSFLGMQTQTIKAGKNERIDVVMKNKIFELNEIVAIGYGIEKKSSITGSVASVQGDKIVNVSSSALVDGLVGKVAGLDVERSLFSGDDPPFRIRGDRSLSASNQPLIIVDGVESRFNTISPFDIESLEVLKDAAATAIYGSRGANGVILITTKPMQDSVINISYNISYGIDKLNYIDMMSGDKWSQFRRDGMRFNNGWDKGEVSDDKIFFPGELLAIQTRNYHDWQKLMFRDGHILTQNMSFGWRKDRTSYLISGTIVSDKGYILTNHLKKYNLTFTLDHAINRSLDFITTLRFSNNQTDGFTELTENDIRIMNPLSKPYDEQGQLIEFPVEVQKHAYNILANTNPNAFQEKTIDKTREYLFKINWKISNALTIRNQLGIQDQLYRFNFFHGSRSFERKRLDPMAGKSSANYAAYTWNSMVNYQKKINSHFMNLDLVFESVEKISDRLEASGRNQPDERTSYHNLGTSPFERVIGSDYNRWSLVSYLGRVRYDYMNRYLVNFSVRYDGSSRLSKGKKWGLFPALSMAWLVSNEDFFSNSRISSLKFRSSYGEVGNTIIPTYTTIPRLSHVTYAWGDDGYDYWLPGSALFSRDLGWEKSKNLNFGIDMGLDKNRFTATLDVYLTRTINVLMNRSLPSTSGYTSTWQNIGTTQNRGMEFNFKYLYSNNHTFQWSTNLLFAYNQERIVKLVGDADKIGTSWFVGQPLSVIYDYQFEGIWQLGEEAEAARYYASPGMIKVVDQNKDKSIDPEKDRIVLGQTVPKFTGGLNSEFQYKNFDLSLSVNGRWGYLINSKFHGERTEWSGTVWLPEVDYWTPENPTNAYPTPNAGVPLYNYQQVLGYMKGDHIKVHQIVLGYNLTGILQKWTSIDRIRIYSQISDPLYLYRRARKDVQPESAGSGVQYAIPTKFILGINANF